MPQKQSPDPSHKPSRRPMVHLHVVLRAVIFGMLAYGFIHLLIRLTNYLKDAV
jgi:hypothetical protein